jgi:enoyl-CoA hydratase/carnithine racemase
MASCSSAAKQKQERARKETTGIPHSQVDARTLTLFETPPAPRAFRNKTPDVRVTFDNQGSAPAVADANQEMFLSIQSADFREGVQHFIEKRPAAFTGE